MAWSMPQDVLELAGDGAVEVAALPGFADAFDDAATGGAERAAVLTAALLTPRPSAISVSDCSGGSASSSHARTRPSMRVPPISSKSSPIVLDEHALFARSFSVVHRDLLSGHHVSDVKYTVNVLNATRRMRVHVREA